MKRNLITSALAVVVFTVLLGLVYPLVITGISQVAFGKNADGNPDLIATDEARLDASAAEKDADGNAVTDPRYFQPRPVADRLQRQRDLLLQPRPQPGERAVLLPRPARRVHRAQRPDNPGLTNARSRPTPSPRPARASTRTSPSPTRASRRAASRACAASRSRASTSSSDDNTDGRFLGLLGEPGVNTTKLNEALGR